MIPRDRFHILRESLTLGSTINTFLQSRNLSQLLASGRFFIQSPRLLYDFLNFYQQDWAWPELFQLIEPVSVAGYVLDELDSLTWRYVSSDNFVDHVKANHLARLGLLDGQAYILMTITRPQSQLWYENSQLIANLATSGRKILLTQIIDYGVGLGWNLITPLKALFPSREAVIAVKRSLKLHSFNFEELLAFIQLGYSAVDLVYANAVDQNVISQALVELVNLCSPKTMVKVINSFKQVWYLKIPLLNFLSVAISHTEDLTVELVELVLTEQDLGHGLVDSYPGGFNPDHFQTISTLLPWYQPDRTADGSVGTVQLAKFVAQYPSNVNKLTVYLIASKYGLVWPVPVHSINTWRGFENSALAAFYIRKYYPNGLNGVPAVPRIDGRPEFGGIDRAQLRKYYNLVELI